MATNNRPTKSPRVKIRWCRTVRCLTTEVYLILTSCTDCQINLTWKDELGWYESDLVDLPIGLHSGNLLIRENVKSYIFKPNLQEVLTVKEREYKIDPFFVTPHKFSVELFINSGSNSQSCWADSETLRQRYFSSQHLRLPSEERESEQSSRKWSSSYELRNSSEESDVAKNRTQLTTYVSSEDIFPPRFEEKSKNESFKSKSDQVLFENSPERLGSPTDLFNLRKCSSLEDKFKATSSKLATFDSSLYASKSRSLYFQEHPKDKTSFRDDSFESQITKACSGKSVGNLSSIDVPKLEGIGHSSASEETWSGAELSDVNSETITKIKDILGQLESKKEKTEKAKYYFKELDPQEISEGGYGCLITFESCSSSMDDLGSPRALEEVLVSLTSSDTEANKYSDHFRDVETIHPQITAAKDTIGRSDNNHGVTNFNLGRILRDPHPSLETENNCEEESVCELSVTDKSESRYPESDITINEDENFQYDSLKHDGDQTIPLNIRDVLDSEDSLEYSVNTSKEQDIPQRSRQNLFQGNSRDKNQSVNSSESTYREAQSRGYDFDYKRTGFYNLRASKQNLSSADGNVAVSPLVLVHPGSLRSESENGGSGTFVVNTESDSTPSEIELFKAISTVRKLSDSIKTLKEPLEPSFVQETQKATPSKRTKIVIVRDKRPQTMNSETQTTYRDTYNPKVLEKSSRLRTRPRRVLKYSPSSTLNSTNGYIPLPDKVQGPWSSKYANSSSKTTEEQFRKSILEKFQQNFKNLVKVENILKNISPNGDCSDSDSKYYDESLSNKRYRQPQLSNSKVSNYRSYSRPLSTVSSNSVSTYVKPSVSFQPTSTPKLPNGVHRYSIPREFYSSPTRLKEVVSPLFSIYGKDALRRHSALPSSYKSPTPILKSSATISGLRSSAIRPASSLPDVRGSFEEVGSPVVTVSQNYRRRPLGSTTAPRSPSKLTTESASRLRRFRARRSESDLLRQNERNSSGSTDSLIEEANQFCTNSNLRTDVPNYGVLPSSSTYRRRNRTRSAGWISTSLQSQRSVSPSWMSTTSSPRQENSISSALRARSDTDLRMVGILADGYKGQQPYLPYNKRELSVGQVVKVLVPGEGVAMARVVYAPPDDKFQYSRFNDNISVLLISEPTNLSGSVINVPMNKILLAWPKMLL